jgi:hypothetical protein
MAMQLSYAKWDHLEDSDDEREREAAATEASNPEYSVFARGVLSHPVMSQLTIDMHEDMKLADGELERILEWIVTQQNDDKPDNTSRADLITRLYESKPPPRVEMLTEIVWTVRKRLEGRCRQAPPYDLRFKPAHESSKTTDMIMQMLMGSLNTLIACNDAGGARRLYKCMRKDPNGQVATEYRDCKYAERAIEGAAAAELARKSVFDGYGSGDWFAQFIPDLILKPMAFGWNSFWNEKHVVKAYDWSGENPMGAIMVFLLSLMAICYVMGW